jgi:hypothetical protein
MTVVQGSLQGKGPFAVRYHGWRISRDLALLVT